MGVLHVSILMGNGFAFFFAASICRIAIREEVRGIAEKAIQDWTSTMRNMMSRPAIVFLVQFSHD
jgi:hypothetical protein